MTRKLIAVVLLSVTLITVFGAGLTLSTHENEEYIYTYGDKTVSFDYDTPFNEYQRQTIANGIFSIEEAPIISPLEACSHAYTTGTATSTSHNVYSSSPRCVQYTYSVTICSKCSYISSQTLITSERIGCCS